MLGQVRQLSPVVRLGLVAAAGALALARPDPAACQAARAEAPAWTASVEAGPSVRGERGAAVITLTARGGFHVNEEYPLSFRPTGVPELGLVKERYGKVDGLVLEPCASGGKDACTAKLPVAFTPVASGTLTLAGTLAFSVCNPEKCLIEQAELGVPIDVAEPR
jgi:hypothetical protein